MKKYEKIKIFFMGVMTALLFFVLIAATTNSRSDGEQGPYQMAIGADKYVYVLDTQTSGVVKIFVKEIPKVENITR